MNPNLLMLFGFLTVVLPLLVIVWGILK